jgi:hypothetical protein
MADMWPVIERWWRVAEVGSAVEAHVVTGHVNRDTGLEIWNAAGSLRSIDDPGIWGLEGSLHTPAGPYPGWYTPMFIRLAFYKGEMEVVLDLRLEQLNQTRRITQAQSVSSSFLQEWEPADGSPITEMTSVRFYNPLFDAIAGISFGLSPHAPALLATMGAH